MLGCDKMFKKMKILVACESSGRVRDAFRVKSHDAWSCDVVDSENESDYHIKDDVLNHLGDGWDMMIAFPPCTYLTTAGNRWYDVDRYGDIAIGRKIKQRDAFNFVMKLANANIDKIAIENPVGYLNTHWKKPTQIIQPFYFGEFERKRTCLWLKNLPLLQATKIVNPVIHGYLKTGIHAGEPLYYCDKPGFKNRSVDRSRTFPGIANAMAGQWS